MKILWLCNVLLPELSVLTQTKPVFVGGWMSGLYRGIVSLDQNLHFVFVCPGDSNKCYKQDSLRLYTFRPKTKTNILYFETILKNENPDIIHIHGTEFYHSFEMLQAAKMSDMLDNTVISLQGIVGYYAKHFYSNLSFKDVYGFSLRDLIKIDNVFFGKKAYEKRGKIEKETIKLGKYFMGRTNWDKACLKLINKNAVYYHANEILRDSFYKGSWKLDNCEKHTIFVTQANYPIKGFHILLKAVGIVKKYYPCVKVFTTSSNFLKPTLKSRIAENHYTKVLRRIIKRNKLQDNIVFMGGLNEESIKSRLIKSHIFVLPSSIENSPNSLGEAMLLGVPCIASDVGGVPDMLGEKEGFLYQYDAEYMLAYYIMMLFENDDLCNAFSVNSRNRALKTHCIKDNASNVLSIYKDIADRIRSS